MSKKQEDAFVEAALLAVDIGAQKAQVELDRLAAHTEVELRRAAHLEEELPMTAAMERISPEHFQRRVQSRRRMAALRKRMGGKGKAKGKQPKAATTKGGDPTIEKTATVKADPTIVKTRVVRR